MKRIIFHLPVAVDGRSGGSQIRPIKMIEAFKKIGYKVDEVMGYVKERREAIDKIKKNIKNGINYAFVYSESSTMPTALTQPHHLPIAPFLDFDFFKFCKQNHIKIGLFYRDVYWVFNAYKQDVSFFKRVMAKFFYRYDLKNYSNYLDILYLPSVEMANYIPISFKRQIVALPPAIEPKIINKKIIGLDFIYVGGLSKLYNLELFSKVASEFNDCTFHLCTREGEWKRYKENYLHYNIEVYHLTGKSLDKIYQKSDIAIYFIKPDILWSFAMGVKLFEYIAHKKPIIGIKNTAVGTFIEKYNIGWVLEYKEERLRALLIELQTNPLLIEEKINNIEKIIPYHTWSARAKQVVEELG